MLPFFLDRPIQAAKAWNHERISRLREKQCYPFRVGVLGIMKDESLNIKEWIEHYLWQGIEQIYLIDNGSTDSTLDIVRPWVETEQVKLVSLTKPGRQREHYITALRKFRIAKECEWLLMADIDEFWFCRDGSKISDMLGTYEKQTEVIYTNWSVFGSNGHLKHPVSLRTDFVKRQERAPARSRGSRKWICRTKTLKQAKNVGVHHIKNACSGRTLTDNDTFQLNHYQIQSEEFFRASKMTRGDASNSDWNELRTMEYFNSVDRFATIEDRALANMVIHAKGV
jgi:glycosyltransferase involved in cell wall biosynthesis